MQSTLLFWNIGSRHLYVMCAMKNEALAYFARLRSLSCKSIIFFSLCFLQSKVIVKNEKKWVAFHEGSLDFILCLFGQPKAGQHQICQCSDCHKWAIQIQCEIWLFSFCCFRSRRLFVWARGVPWHLLFLWPDEGDSRPVFSPFVRTAFVV